MSVAKTIGFSVHCEAPGRKISITSDNTDVVRIPFTVARLESGPARVAVRIVPLSGPAAGPEARPLPPEQWQLRLSLEGEQEQGFDGAGFRSLNVLAQLPDEGLAALGSYTFKLLVALLDTVPFYLGSHALSRYLRLPPPGSGSG